MHRIFRAGSHAAEKASINAGTWYFAPIGGLITALLLFLSGASMSFGRWIDDPLVRSVFEGSACVVFAYIFAFLFWFTRAVVFGIPAGDASFFKKLGRRVNFAVVTAILGGLLLVGGLSYYFCDRSRGPIVWTWGANSPLSFWRQGSDPLLVYSFNFQGRNRSDDPIRVKSAIVTLDTAQRIPLMMVVNGTPQPVEGYLIKVGEKFTLHSLLKHDKRRVDGPTPVCIDLSWSHFDLCPPI